MRCLYNGVHPCGKCPACLANRQRAFCFRLDQERNSCAFYYWLTLTYSDEYLPRDELTGEIVFDKSHCRQFFEVLRKRYSGKGYKFKHFLVSEYGPSRSHRSHYHCLLLVYSDNSVRQLYEDRKEMRDFILEKAWPFGFVTEKAFHGRVLSYLTKYCTKPDLIGEKHIMKPFALISPGIGESYIDSLTEDQKREMIAKRDFSVRYGSGKMQLPRYIVDKIIPHSAQELRRSMIFGTEFGDWTWYESVRRIRKDLEGIANSKAIQRYNGYDQLYGIEMFNYLERNREANFEEFRSKLRSRKDL